MTRLITFEEADPRLDWLALCDALEAGHKLPKAEIADTFLYRGSDTLLSRAAWIDGMGLAVKSATVFPNNPAQGLSRINGGVSLFSDTDGALEAVLDFHLVTKWKTAGDSLMAARRLARSDASRILIVGAGTVSENLISAYRAGFPEAEFRIWNRTPESAERVALKHGVEAVRNLADSVGWADIVGCATMSTDPVIKGEWLQAGTHVDLIGAYRPDMREVDDTALLRARVFVDSHETVQGHIGELKIPLEQGIIQPDHVIADYYEWTNFTRTDDAEITIAKNGGGAHLDLMTARYILAALG